MTPAPGPREIAAHDPSRRPPYWTACLQPGECAVRYFDPKTKTTLGVDGKPIGSANDRVLVFEGRASAERFCEAEIELRPNTGCLLYDWNGVLLATYVNAERAAELAKPPSRMSHLLKGSAYLIVGGGLMLWDWSRRWTIMIGVLLGIRLAITGVVHLWKAARARGSNDS